VIYLSVGSAGLHADPRDGSGHVPVEDGPTKMMMAFMERVGGFIVVRRPEYAKNELLKLNLQIGGYDEKSTHPYFFRTLKKSPVRVMPFTRKRSAHGK
jgi:hypothetical protein